MNSISLYTTDQTRELDRTAIQEFGIPGLVLMERAGRAAFNHIMQRYSGRDPVVVLCGAGNNGGDGYVVARLLHEVGFTVRVITASEPKTDDARAVWQNYKNAGGRIENVERSAISDAELIVDGLLGSGLSSAPTGMYAELIHAANQCAAPVVALDLPSGLSGDTGEAFDPCIRADTTVTFIGRKVGQMTADGPDHCGELIFDDLALEREIYGRVEPAATISARPAITARPRNSHKGLFGHVVVTGGEPGMLGAVVLAGRAALRTGAGLVSVLSVAEHLDQPVLSQPELMGRKCDALSGGEQAFAGADAIVFGPGIANSRWSQELFRGLPQQDCAQVVDAGGLRLLATAPDHRPNRVLTPHPGEAAALLNVKTSVIQVDRIAAAREIQDRFGGICVLKGVGTVIAGEHQVEICDRGNPGMASAGMGDVLSGVIGALLASGQSPWDAARQGVWWHAAAGDLGRSDLGERALLASDVIERLATVMSESIS